MIVRLQHLLRTWWDSDMSNRADPNLGREKPSGRVRQMTVYDRLEDARKRRQALFAERGAPAAKPATALKASNDTTPPRQTPAKAEPLAADVSVTRAPAPSPKPRPESKFAPTAQRPQKSSTKAYWAGLFQAMAAIAIVAVLIAMFSSRGETPENPAAATALVQPDVTTVPLTSPETAAEIEPVVASFLVLRAGPKAPLAPQQTAVDARIAALVSPTFETPVALFTPATPDGPPTELDQFPPFERPVPPVALQRIPPARPVSATPVALSQPEPTPEPEPEPSLPFFGDVTNVVLMVPAFVPQAQAEETISIAAANGVPVDQTRRASVSISRTNIRYYHAEDAQAAIQLAESLGGQARDFTNFTPPPNPGVIEIWMEGRGGNASASQGSATSRGIEADLQALRDSIQRALFIATGN